MSFKEYAIPLPLNIRPSSLYRAVMIAAHGAVMGLVLLTVYDRLLVALCLSFLIINALYWLSFTAKTMQLNWREDNLWDLTREGVHDTDLMLVGSPFIETWMISLALQNQAGKKRRVVIMPDALNREDYRRLTVRLKASS